MFHVFTRGREVFFYSFIVALLCGGYETGSRPGGGDHSHSNRAPRFCPDTIKLSGSTFEAEKITVAEPPGTMLKIPHKPGHHQITFGNTVLSYGTRSQSCWFHHNSKKCLSQMVADKPKGRCVQRYDNMGCKLCPTDAQGNAIECPKMDCGGFKVKELVNKCVKYEGGGGHHVVIKKNGKEIGVVEFDDKAGKLYAYSISAPGQKDPKKPYLEFHEVASPVKQGADSSRSYKLTVTAYAGGRVIGKYESLSNDRNTGTGKPENCPNSVLDLRGKQFLLKEARN